MDSAAALDGWVEGPTWTSPLNASQLTALLVLMNAARELRLKAWSWMRHMLRASVLAVQQLL